MNLKYKSLREKGLNSFELKSPKELFFIHPEYQKIVDAKNFDVCLIKMPANEYGIHEDISSEFASIPCLAEKVELEKVSKFNL